MNEKQCKVQRDIYARCTGGMCRNNRVSTYSRREVVHEKQKMIKSGMTNETCVRNTDFLWSGVE